MKDFYETEGFEANLDVSSSNRKFQISVIVKQDPQKTGILQFLTESEQSGQSQPTSSQPSTIRPSGGYS